MASEVESMLGGDELARDAGLLVRISDAAEEFRDARSAHVSTRRELERAEKAEYRARKRLVTARAKLFALLDEEVTDGR